MNTSSINFHEVYKPETIAMPPPRVDIIAPAEDKNYSTGSKNISKILIRGHSQPHLRATLNQSGKDKVISNNYTFLVLL